MFFWLPVAVGVAVGGAFVLLSKLLAQGTGPLSQLLVLVLAHLDPTLAQDTGHVHSIVLTLEG